MPVLVDANGKPFDVVKSQMSRSMNNGVIVQELTLVFRPGTGVGEPTQMVLLGHRMVTAQVPFRFEAVRLP